MNTDPRKSAMPCGCDEGENHPCDRHKEWPVEPWQMSSRGSTKLFCECRGLALHVKRPNCTPLTFGEETHLRERLDGTDPRRYVPENIPERRPLGMAIFPADAAGRKEYPMFTGLLAYFPDALAAVAHVSYVGNKQHNGADAPLRWAREKSTDQTDTAIRHQMDHVLVDTKDADGCYHLAKSIWRQCAELQLTIEKERNAP